VLHFYFGPEVKTKVTWVLVLDIWGRQNTQKLVVRPFNTEQVNSALLLTFLQGVQGSDVSRDTKYLEGFFMVFLSLNWAMTMSFYNLFY
jgi:hypothetical protein